MITSFRGEHSFLSNFYPIDIVYKNEVYPSVEHAFQAAKCLREEDRRKIRLTSSATTAKFIGRRVEMRSSWDSEKMSVMEDLLRKKFLKPKMSNLLKTTGTQQIIEVNRWHDTFWGVCSCGIHKSRGKNMLGVLLMEVRKGIEKNR